MPSLRKHRLLADPCIYVKTGFHFCPDRKQVSIMSSVEELREKFVGNSDAAREAFEELAARLEAMELMKNEHEDKVR